MKKLILNQFLHAFIVHMIAMVIVYVLFYFGAPYIAAESNMEEAIYNIRLIVSIMSMIVFLPMALLSSWMIRKQF